MNALRAHNGDVQQACDRLVDAVLQSGRCTDNVTAVLVLLYPGAPPPAPSLGA